MHRDEMILALGNALICLERVETKGEASVSALLMAMQGTKKVYNAMKGEMDRENHDQQRENV